MDKLSVSTMSIANDVVDDEKHVPLVVDADLDTGKYEEKFVADVVMVQEANINKSRDVKDTKVGEGTKLGQGEEEFLEKDGNFMTISTNKNDLMVMEVMKGEIDGEFDKLETVVSKMPTKDEMVETTLISNVEMGAIEMVQGGENDKVKFDEDDWKSRCLSLGEDDNIKGKAIVASGSMKDQVEAEGMKSINDNAFVETDLEPREQDTKDRQLETLEDTHDEIAFAMSNMKSIKVSVAKDDDDVVIEGQDNVLAAHMMKPRFENPHLEIQEILEDGITVISCEADEKHGGIEPVEAMIRGIQSVHTTRGDVEEIGDILVTKDNVLNNVYTKLDQVGEIDVILSKLSIVTTTIVEGEFSQDSIEKVAESSKNNTCLDSSDVRIKETIMLDQGGNYDVMDINYDKKLFAEEGEVTIDSQCLLENEFVEDKEHEVTMKDESILPFGCTLDNDLQQKQDNEFVEEDSPLVFIHSLHVDLGATHEGTHQVGVCLMKKDNENITTTDSKSWEVDSIDPTIVECVTSPRAEGKFTQDVCNELDQLREIDSTSSKLSMAMTNIVEGEYIQVGVDRMVKLCKKDSCLYSSDMRIEEMVMLDQGEKNYGGMEINYEKKLFMEEGDVSHISQPILENEFVEDKKYAPEVVMEDESMLPIEGTLEKCLQQKQDNKFVQEEAPLVFIHSPQVNLDATLEQEEETGACLVKKDDKATTITDSECEVDSIDAIVSECVTSTRVEVQLIQDVCTKLDQLGEIDSFLSNLSTATTTVVEGQFAQGGVERVDESCKPDSYLDSSNARMEAMIMLDKGEKKCDIMEKNYEKILFAEEGEASNVSQPLFKREFVEDKKHDTEETIEDESMVPFEVTLEKGLQQKQDNEFVQEATQDVLTVNMSGTLSSKVNNASIDLDEMEDTSQLNDYETTIISRVDVSMALGGEENKGTSNKAKFVDVAVEARSKSNMDVTENVAKDTGTTMNDSHVVIPQDKLSTVEGASIEWSISLTTQSVQESEEKVVPNECESKHASKMTTEEAKLPLKMELVKDWHIIQEDTTSNECTSFASIHTPKHEATPMLGEVDRMHANSKDTSMVLEANKGVLAVDMVVTTSIEANITSDGLDEMKPTFQSKGLQKRTQVGIEYIQDETTRSMMEPSMEYPYFATCEAPKVDTSMVFGLKEEKDISVKPKFVEAVAKVGGKSDVDFHMATKGEFTLEEGSFLPLHTADDYSLSPLCDVEEIVATSTARESDSMVVVKNTIDQLQDLDAALVRFHGTMATKVEGEFTQDASLIGKLNSSKQITCVESLDMLEEAKPVLIQEGKKCESMKGIIMDIVPTEESTLENFLQQRHNYEFARKEAPLVSKNSPQIHLEKHDSIDATTIECVTPIRELTQERMEIILDDSRWKDEYVDSSHVKIDADIISCPKDKNDNTMKAKYEEALLIEEGKMEKDSVVEIGSELVPHILSTPLDETKVELDVVFDDAKEIGAVADVSHIISQENLRVVDDTSIESSISLITQSVEESNENVVPSEWKKKQSPKMSIEDEAMLPLKMVLVKDRDIAQENSACNECSSLASLHTPKCDVENILGKVDGVNDNSEDICMVTEVDQDYMAYTASNEVNNASDILHEKVATFQSKDSQTIAQVVAKDIQNELVKSTIQPSIVNASMMLGREEEKDTRMELKFVDTMVETRGKPAMDFHLSTKEEFIVEEAFFVPPHSPDINSHASLGEVEETQAIFKAKENESMLVVNTMVDQPQEVDSTSVELCGTTDTIFDGEYIQDVSEIGMSYSRKKFSCLETLDMLDEAKPVFVEEDKIYDTMEGMLDVVVTTEEGTLEVKGLHRKHGSEFYREDTPLVAMHPPHIHLNATPEEEEIGACLVENDNDETIAIDSKLYEMGMVEPTTSTRVEGKFTPCELKMTVVESSKKEEYVNSSNVLIEEDITLGKKNENYDTMEVKCEEALPTEEGIMKSASVVTVDSEFVSDDMLASPNMLMKQPVSFDFNVDENTTDFNVDGNTTNDDVVVVSDNEDVCDGFGKAIRDDGTVSSDQGLTQFATFDRLHASKTNFKNIEDVDNNDDGDEKGLSFDASTSHLKPTNITSLGGNIIVTPHDSSILSPDHLASLNSSAPSLKSSSTPPPSCSSTSSITELEMTPNPIEAMTEDEKKLHEKLELIRVKFLRLVCRMGATPEESVVAQVLRHLSLAECTQHGQASNLHNAWDKALHQEAESQEELSFSCNILVIGKTGVGKSATINSIFGEEKSNIDAFDASTTTVREISGNLDGFHLRIIDTPGLRTNLMDQGWNKKILSAVKSYTKKCPPHMVFYVDRLDSWSHDGDLPLLRTITATLGTSIWLNAIVTLTHAASTPPDSPNGDPMTYETLVEQRSDIIRQSIRQAASDMSLMNPMALVENHPYCQRNRQGQMVLPNGQAWKNQLLLLCSSTKTLSEANCLLKLHDSSPREYSSYGYHSLPLPFLLFSLLQPRSHPKLSTEQRGHEEDSDVDLDDYLDNCNDEDEYDRLPSFKPLTKLQFHKLTKDQKNGYLNEYDYRVKLLQKKQWKGELQRLKEIKKRGKAEQDSYGYGSMAGENGQDPPPEHVAVPSPDMVLPPSFDCNDPTYRYRFLEPISSIISRPILDVHGWDHDCSFDGVSIEDTLAIAREFPATFSVQLNKDKKKLTIHLESSISGKHGTNVSSLAGFDVQTVRQQLAYALWGETKFKNMKKNKTAGGFSMAFLGNTMASGVKLEDQLSVGKGLSLVASTGAMRARGSTAYGTNLEACLKEKVNQINRFMLVLGLSLMKWGGDLALGTNMQSEFSVGRGSKMALHIGLNNKLSGRINVKLCTSGEVQMAIMGIVPLAASIYKSLHPAEA